jgi:hypothetical protein
MLATKAAAPTSQAIQIRNFMALHPALIPGGTKVKGS